MPENCWAASRKERHTAGSSRCFATSFSRKTASTERVWRCAKSSAGTVVLMVPFAPGLRESPLVTVQTKTGSLSSDATASASCSTRSSSAVSKAITGWNESTRDLRSWTEV